MAEPDDSAPGTPGETVPDRPGGATALIDTLDIPRNARIGVAVGVLFAVLVYAYRFLEVFGPAPDAAGPVYFLMLAFVLAVGVALLTTVVLTVRTAVREARELEE